MEQTVDNSFCIQEVADRCRIRQSKSAPVLKFFQPIQNGRYEIRGTLSAMTKAEYPPNAHLSPTSISYDGQYLLAQQLCLPVQTGWPNKGYGSLI